ncbi:MAG: hypothetical protein KF893_04990 [Caldilineaceae bacterium]|nr:hypothetical protein [Caldilineaceae bacterium]
MPTLYTANSEKWKLLADVDYFTQFVMAWIPFNAWYRNYYPSITRDREAINEIKSNPNSFRDRLHSLITGNGNECEMFRSFVSQLHYELGRKYIYNNGDRVSFESIVVEINPKTIESISRNGCTYEAKRNIPSRPGNEVVVSVTNRTSAVVFSYTQTSGYNLTEIESQVSFRRLSAPQQTNLRQCYTAINPRNPISLISRDLTEDNSIRMGTYHFINNPDLLCKGLIEVLYLLRNGLFHGEIVPDRDTNAVYEPAYRILHMLIQAL